MLLNKSCWTSFKTPTLSFINFHKVPMIIVTLTANNRQSAHISHPLIHTKMTLITNPIDYNYLWHQLVNNLYRLLW